MAVLPNVESHHRDLVSNIREASDISSTSVLAIGGALTEVVQCALEIKELVDRLRFGEPGDGASPDALARPAEAFGAAVTSGLARSRELLERALGRAHKVGGACEELLQVTGMCRTLVMHTRIESARVGGGRGGMASTGEHMNAFTAQMVDATLQAQEVQGDLVNLLDDLLTALDRFAQLADRLKLGLEERLRDMYTQEAERQQQFRDAVQALLDATDRLVVRSQDAVSVLQFQDPAVQRLQRLDSLAQDLRRSLGDTTEAIRWAERLGDRLVVGEDESPAALAGRARAFCDDVTRRTEDFEAQSREAMQQLATMNQELRELAEAQARAGHEAIRHAQSEDRVGAYLDAQLRGVDRALSDYHALATQGQTLCERILQVQRAISRVARRAETPALNVSLQASKAGVRGRPMAVIANEMVTVSRQVAKTTERVEEHASVLLEAIPGLQRSASELVEHGKVCADSVAELMAAMDQEHARTRAELHEALAEIERVQRRVEGATEVAVEHLGFPDRLVRPLKDLRASAEHLRDAAVEALGVSEEEIGDADWSDEEVLEHASGELILF